MADIDWDHTRQFALVKDGKTPPTWPPDVKGISTNGLNLLGINQRTRELYWDGEKLVTERKLATFDRVLAVLGLLVGAVVAVVEVGNAAGWWE